MSEVVLAPIVGVSPAIKRAVHLVERFAPTTLPILLVGATGTGKELFARHIHYVSRRAGELIDVNCGALPQEIADSLLFGHRRGAFTGAVDSVEGHLERADRGTLFLDEVLHLSPAAQVKLLRALETMEVQRVGDRVKHRVDFRVVSAAHEDTRQRLDAGMFRHDLFQRLAGIVIELPLLVDRPDDIVLLAEHFAAARGQRLEPDSAAVLQNYEWPGNVRELRLAIERAGYLVDNGTLPPGALRDGIEEQKSSGNQSSAGFPERTGGVAMSLDARPMNSSHCAAGVTIMRGSWPITGLRLTATYAKLKRAGISLRELRRSDVSLFRRNSAEKPKDRHRHNT